MARSKFFGPADAFNELVSWLIKNSYFDFCVIGGEFSRECFQGRLYTLGLDCGFAEFLYRGLSPSFKAHGLPQIERGLHLSGSHVVAKTQGYYLVYIWGSLVKFQGGGVVLKTMICARLWIC